MEAKGVFFSDAELRRDEGTTCGQVMYTDGAGCGGEVGKPLHHGMHKDNLFQEVAGVGEADYLQNSCNASQGGNIAGRSKTVPLVAEGNMARDVHKTKECSPSGMPGICITFKWGMNGTVSNKHLPSECDVCDKSFDTFRELVAHRLLHEDIKPFGCRVCGIRFLKKVDLTRHEMLHTGKRPHTCPVCGQTFTRKSHCDEHQVKHTGVKPFKCDVCEKTLSSKGGLRRHQEVHLKEVQRCEFCSKEFRCRRSLIQHVGRHNAGRPYKCSMCGKTFSLRSLLVSHRMVHQMERPLSCCICAKGFIDKSQLQSHLQSHEADREPEVRICSLVPLREGEESVT